MEGAALPPSDAGSSIRQLDYGSAAKGSVTLPASVVVPFEIHKADTDPVNARRYFAY